MSFKDRRDIEKSMKRDQGSYKLCVLIVKEDDHDELMITEAAVDFTFSPSMSLAEARSFYEEAVEATITDEAEGKERFASYIGLPVDMFRKVLSDASRAGLEGDAVKEKLDEAVKNL